MRRWLAALTFLAVAAPTPAAEPAWAPAPVDWAAPADSPASVSFLLPTPAGKDGFIRSEGGHLVTPSGPRFRIWGVNLTMRATTPSREAAPLLAAHLARCGVNCVRFHFLDRPAPTGILDPSRNDTRALDPAQLDRLDFFIAQLKVRGIYADLNLNVGRTYKPGDGVADAELLGFAKALTYFDPHLLELQEEYARQLLTHKNPYTGREYRDEPAVALVEFVNENSIVESWFSGRLLGRATRRNPGTWTDIPARYEKDLTALYNRWLADTLAPDALACLRKAAGVADGQPVPRLQPAEFNAAPAERFHTEARFYMDLERRWFDRMARFLREELKVRSLLVGTADHNHGRSGYPLLASTSRLDVVDGHVYWQHPSYRTDPATGRQTGFDIPNTPMVNDPGHSTVVQLSRSAVAGKPYIVSEVNHPFPAEHACEGIPILAAYAALHDWDGVFWYTLAHNPLVGEKPRAIGHFDIGPDPVKMAQLPAGALMFLRADVRPAKQTATRSYSAEQVRESLRLPWAQSPYFTPGFPRSLPLLQATRITSFDGPPIGSFGPAPAEPYVSDTGEISWTGAAKKQGVVAINTPRSQALVGFVADSPPSTDNLALKLDIPFAAVTLGSLDGRPIAQSSRLLLTATARVGNSGMRWNDKHTSLDAWGSVPPVIEPVTGAVLFKGLGPVKMLTARPLHPNGQPMGEPVRARPSSDAWELPLGRPATTSWQIEVAR